jgi:hypothetical protein
MAIANTIAQAGMSAGRNIQNTVGNGLVRHENQKRYEAEQLAREKAAQTEQARYQNEQSRMQRTDQLNADKYADTQSRQGRVDQLAVDKFASEQNKEQLTFMGNVLRNTQEADRPARWQSMNNALLQKGKPGLGEYNEDQARNLIDGYAPQNNGPAPTEIEKLINFRNGLPEGHADRAVINQRIAKINSVSKGMSLTTNPDGSVSFSQGGSNVPGGGMGDPNTRDKQLGKGSADIVGEDIIQAGKTDNSRQMYDSMLEIMDDPEFTTGALAPVKMSIDSVLAAFGNPRAQQSATSLQRFNALSKNLGAETLQLFGGSDTEKELEVAIMTNPALNKTREANMFILERKMRAIDILRAKPGFKSGWLSENGDLSNPNAQGIYIGEAWGEHQRAKFSSKSATPAGLTSSQWNKFTHAEKQEFYEEADEGANNE